MITKNYIKMCEGTKEIQCDRILGRYEFGDIYYLESKHKHGGKFRFIGSYDGYDKDKELIEKSVWLPTQEQLQEIISCNWHDVFCKFLWWHSDNDKSSEEFESMFTSMNEVWLAFVMKEKYQKTWTGKKWEVTK